MEEPVFEPDDDDDDDGGDPLVNAPVLAEQAVEHAERCVRRLLRGERRIGTYDEHDLVQEVLLAVLAALRRSSNVFRLDLFVGHIARCTMVSVLRREVLRRGAALDEGALEADRHESVMEAMDELRAISVCLYPFNQAVIALVRDRGFDLDDDRELICQELNCSRAELRASIARIRAAARKRAEGTN